MGADSRSSWSGSMRPVPEPMKLDTYPRGQGLTDTETILASATKTGCVVTAEEGQIAGGLGGAVCELLSQERPTRVLRLGVDDRYGETGGPRELLEAFELTGAQLAAKAKAFLQAT